MKTAVALDWTIRGTAAIGLGAVILATSPYGANAASATGQISATILQGSTVAAVSPLTVVQTSAIASSRGISVATTTTSATSSTRGIPSTATSQTGSGNGQAVISISGQPNQTVSISLPSEGLTLADGSTVDFSLQSGLTPAIDASGVGTFGIDASIATPSGDFTTQGGEDLPETPGDAFVESDGQPAAEGKQDGSTPSAESGTGESDSGSYLQMAVASKPPQFNVIISYN